MATPPSPRPPGQSLASVAFHAAGVGLGVTIVTATWETALGWIPRWWHGTLLAALAVYVLIVGVVAAPTGLLRRSFAMSKRASGSCPIGEVQAPFCARSQFVAHAVIGVVTVALFELTTRLLGDPVHASLAALAVTGMFTGHGVAIALADRVTGTQVRYWVPLGCPPLAWHAHQRGELHGYIHRAEA